jgi:hypothetical protein
MIYYTIEQAQGVCAENKQLRKYKINAVKNDVGGTL